MATYYVRESNSSDGNAGTISAPYRTIGKALAVAGNGATILVRGGTYKTERALVITQSNLTLKAYPGETPTIDMNWITGVPTFANHPGFGNDDVPVIYMKGSGCTVDGLTLQNSPGRMLTMTAPNCTVTNCAFRNAFGAGVVQIGADNATMTNLSFSRMSRRGEFYGKNWIDGNNRDPSKVIENHPHVVGPRSHTSWWENVEIHDSFGEGFSNYTGYGATWKNCKISDTASPTVYLNYSPGFTMYNCEVYFTSNYIRPRNKRRGETATFGDEAQVDKIGKGFVTTTKDVQIYNNIFVGYGNGLSFGGDIAPNKTYGRPANAENVLIANNTFLIHPDGLTDESYYSFLINRMTYDETPFTFENGVQVWRYQRNVRIENNVFYGRIKSSNPTSRQMAAFRFRNNYFSVAPPSWMTSGNNTNNIVGGAHGLVSVAPPTLLAYGEVGAAHDDFDADDYKLTAGSALVGAGIPNEVNAKDFFGTVRSTSAPDIGFHEYTSGGAPSVTVTANFTVSATQIEEGDSITLTDTSTISAGAIDTWDWDYKEQDDASWTDHSTSSSPSALTLNTAGIYLVRLVVTDTESGESSQKTVQITVLATGTNDPGTCTGNVLTNADFASGSTGWSFNAGGGAGSLSTASGYASVTVTTPAGNMQLYQSGFAITSGEQYRLAFIAKSDEARTCAVFLFDHTTIQNLGLQAWTFTPGTDWTLIEVIFTATASSSNARLQIRPSYPAGDVQFDDFCLAAYSAPAGPEAIITVPSDPATVGVEQTLSAASSTGSPTSYSWSINGAEVGTSSTYAWTPTTQSTYTIALTVTNAYGSDTTTIYVDANAAASGGTGTVAALVTGAVPGSTGAVGYDHTDLGTATGGLLMLVSGATTAGTAFNDALIGVGGSDGTNGRAVAASSDDAQADVSSGVETEAATAYLVSSQHTMIVDGDAALTDADTVTMTWNTISSGKLFAALRIAASNAAAGDFAMGGAAVNVGFQPDVVFCWTGKNTETFSGSGGASGNMSFGFVTADGTRGLLWRSTTGSASGNVYALHSQTYVCGYLQSTLTDGITVTINATGFSHATSGAGTGKVGYLALKLDGLSTQIIDFDTKTSTGTQSHTADFEAGAAVMLASLCQAYGTVEGDADASVWGVGFWDGTNERSAAITDEDAAATTNTSSHVQNKILTVPSDAGADNILATVDSVSDTTFVLNYTAADATARKASVLLIEQASGASSLDINYIQPGIVSGAISGMP